MAPTSYDMMIYSNKVLELKTALEKSSEFLSRPGSRNNGKLRIWLHKAGDKADLGSSKL